VGIVVVAGREGQLDAESKQVIPEIIDVSDRMNRDMFSVSNQVESVARLVAMRKKMEKDGLDWDSEKLCRFDYAWDWVGGGIAERLRHKNMAGWQGFKRNHSELVRRKRLTTPPQDTRAKVRGELVAKRAGNNNSTWTHLDTSKYSYIHPLYTGPTEDWE